MKPIDMLEIVTMQFKQSLADRGVEVRLPAADKVLKEHGKKVTKTNLTDSGWVSVTEVSYDTDK